MNLPLVLQMEIDLSVMAHKREIAEGFAKLRAELTPPPEPESAAVAYMRAISQASLGAYFGSSQTLGQALGLATPGWNAAQMPTNFSLYDWPWQPAH